MFALVSFFLFKEPTMSLIGVTQPDRVLDNPDQQSEQRPSSGVWQSIGTA